jgi:flagellar basal body-associated protein FliL
MAEQETKENPEVATPEAPSKKKRTLIAVGGVVGLLVLIGAPAGYFLMKEEPKEVQEVKPDMAPETQHKPEGFEDVEELEEGEEPLGAIVPFDTFLVNLSGGKYIRTQIQVEFETLDVPTKFYTRQVPIRDSIISLLTQQTAEALQSAQGKERIRNDIRNLINQTLRKEDVRRVYFTQFVIQ